MALSSRWATASLIGFPTAGEAGVLVVDGWGVVGSCAHADSVIRNAAAAARVTVRAFIARQVIRKAC